MERGRALDWQEHGPGQPLPYWATRSVRQDHFYKDIVSFPFPTLMLSDKMKGPQWDVGASQIVNSSSIKWCTKYHTGHILFQDCVQFEFYWYSVFSLPCQRALHVPWATFGESWNTVLESSCSPNMRWPCWVETSCDSHLCWEAWGSLFALYTRHSTNLWKDIFFIHWHLNAPFIHCSN